MANQLPPPPFSDSDMNSYSWKDWFRKVRETLVSTGALAWASLDFTGSSLTDIASRSHNVLQTLQGGSPTEYYHINATDYTKLTRHAVIEYNVPIAGFSYTIANTTGVLILEPASGLATGTIIMPATPVNEQTLTITSTQTITAVTHNGNGKTIKGAVTILTANVPATWIYRSASTTWYRIA